MNFNIFSPTAIEAGYPENKAVIFNVLEGIYIEKFRTLEDRYIPLGKNITLISGKNGTMKSTVLGLIAHPFSSPTNAKDSFGIALKTDLRDVFQLSMVNDNQEYRYYLHYMDTEDEHLKEAVRVYPYEKENRHRVVVGKANEKMFGNFFLNTSYLNFKRLYPIRETNASPVKTTINSEQIKFANECYLKVLGSSNFTNIDLVRDKSIKQTIGPKDTFYDYSSISSGEDNLGHIINKMYAFMTNKSEHKGLQGIFCIDEIEAGLHPVAQEKLLTFLLKWSEDNHIQVVATTHSLYLIQAALTLQNKINSNEKIAINMISTQFASKNNYNIIVNPEYSQAYKELTFRDFNDNNSLFKPMIIFEDEIAQRYFKYLIKRREILNVLDLKLGISADETNSGNSYTGLFSLINNGKKLFEDTIFIFDPDVNTTTIETSGANFLKLPGKLHIPLEKLIVDYIKSLDGGDYFFKKHNKEKASFESDFIDSGIIYSTEDELIKHGVRPFKNWVTNCGQRTFNKYLNYYATNNIENEPFATFINDLIEILDKIFINNSFPTIS